MIMIATFFRLLQTNFMNLYLQDYLKVYCSNQTELAFLLAMGTCIGGPFATAVTGSVVDYFYNKSQMTIPWVCIVKALIEVPFMYMIYGQDVNFKLSISGVYCEYFLAKGWTSAAMLILSTVVDPSISYLGITMFIIIGASG